MRFSKLQMQEELSTFLIRFNEQLGAIFGVPAAVWSTKEAVEASPLWETVNEMYEYGVLGNAVGLMSDPDGSIARRHIEVERFLHALNTLPMKLYLDGYENAPPALALLAAAHTAARLVLDGADRRTDFSTDEFGPGEGDFGYLTLAEIALLADMDERSVRNAANPKLPNPLRTEQVGRRSLVRPEEARRWLAGRKGFVATQEPINQTSEGNAPTYDIVLPPAFVEDVRREAKSLRVPFETHLKKRFFAAIERLNKAEGEE